MRAIYFRTTLLASCALALRGSIVAADECTEADFEDIGNIQLEISSSTSCPAVVDPATATVDDICAEDCLSFLSDLTDQLPDCTVSGFSTKEVWQEIVDACSTAAGDTTDESVGDTGDETTGSKGTSSTEPSADECTDADYANIASTEEEIYSSSACPQVLSSTSATVEDVCSDDCLSFLGDLVDKLPDCTVAGYSAKDTWLQLVDACASVTSSAAGDMSGASADSDTKVSSAGGSTANAGKDEMVADSKSSASNGSGGASSAGTALSCLYGAAFVALMLAKQ